MHKTKNEEKVRSLPALYEGTTLPFCLYLHIFSSLESPWAPSFWVLWRFHYSSMAYKIIGHWQLTKGWRRLELKVPTL